MAQFSKPFNPADAPKRFAVLPAGDYPATFIKDQLKESNGVKRIEAEFKLDQPHSGTVWARITVENGTEKAMAFGARQLAELAAAFGVTTPFRSTDQWWGKRLTVRLEVEPARTYNGKNYEASNSAVGFKPFAGATVGAPRPATPTANFSAPPPAAPAAPPRVELPTLDLEAIGPFRGLDAAQLAEHAAIAAEDKFGGLLYESMIRAGYPVESIRAKLSSIKSVLGIATVSIGMADDAPEKTSNALQTFAAKMEAAAQARVAHWASRQPVAVPSAEPETGGGPTDDDLPF